MTAEEIAQRLAMPLADIAAILEPTVPKDGGE